MSETQQPPGYYLDKSAQIKGINITSFALAVIALCLRFTARRLSMAGFWYDDWLMIPAKVSIPDIDFSSNYVESLAAQMELIHVSSVPRRCASPQLFGVSHSDSTESHYIHLSAYRTCIMHQ